MEVTCRKCMGDGSRDLEARIEEESRLSRLISTCRPRQLRAAVEMHEASLCTHYSARCVL